MILDTSHLPIHRLRLPDTCHIPGTHTVAELAWLSRISSRTPDPVCESTWRRNLPYRYGWFLFFNHYYWETHEVWESVWLKTAANSRERFLLQGLIQLANASLKGKQGNTRAQSRILQIAVSLFDEAFVSVHAVHDQPSLMGITREEINGLIEKMH